MRSTSFFLLVLVLTFFLAPFARAAGVRLPEVATVARTSPASVAAPGVVSFTFALTPGTSEAKSFRLRFRTPSGATQSVVLDPISGTTFSAQVGTNWLNGTYVLSSVTVADTWGRALTYNENGTVTAQGGTFDSRVLPNGSWLGVAQGVADVPTTHALNLAALTFTVTGGVAELVPPRLQSLVRKSAAAVTLGEALEFEYKIQPGTSELQTASFRFVFGAGSLFRSVTVAADGPATSGTLRIPITADLPRGTAYLSSVLLADIQGRSANYSSTTISDLNFATNLVTSPHTINFAALDTTVSGTTGAALQPKLVSLTRTPAGAAVTVGNTLTYRYEIDGDGVVPTFVQFRFVGPFGLERDITLTSLRGEFSLPVQSDWINGTYGVVGISLSNPAGPTSYGITVTSDNFTVTGGFVLAPVIKQQPEATTNVFEPRLVDLYSSAIGPAPVSYQWYRGQPGDTSNPIAGATQSSVTVSVSETSTYFVRVTSAGVWIDSVAAIVILVPPPVITAGLVNQSAAVGGSATYSISVQSLVPVTYSWSGGNRYFGDPAYNQPTLTYSNVGANDAGYVICTVSNGAGSVSSRAILNVRVSGAPLRITEQPISQTSVVGGPSVRFTVVADGNPPYVYQWEKDGVPLVNYTGLMSRFGDTLSFIPPKTGDSGTYRMRVTNGFETVYSDPATLTFAVAPYITSQPVAQTVQVGNYIELGAVAIGQQPMTFQWRRNGVPLSGFADAQFRMGPVKTTDDGLYDIVITNAAGSVTSQAARVTVVLAPVAPQIVRTPIAQNVAAGGSLSVALEATGSNLLYDWRKDNRSVPNALSAPFLNLTDLASSDSGLYDTIVTNAAGQVFTTQFQVTVSSPATAPVIVRQPKPRTVRINEWLELSAAANGAMPMTWQWRFNGVPIGSKNQGALYWNTDRLLIGQVTAANAGTYDAVVTNALGTATTTAVNVIFDGTRPGFYALTRHIAGTPDTAVAVGAFATAPNGGAVSYQWLRNGAAVTTPSTDGVFTIGRLRPENAGIYTALATAGGTATGQVIVGLDTPEKVLGAGTEIGSQIQHPNGNIFDQVLLTGAAATIKANPGEVTRISFLDLTDDIVQVEFSGAGTLALGLENASAAAAATKYNQPAVSYVKGHATIVITGANETTNLSVFSVGSITALNQSLFREDVTYDGTADLAALAVLSTNGRFGGLRLANTHFSNAKGITGVYAPGVQFAGPFYVGGISAADTATPVLLLGPTSTVTITGGDLAQLNGAPVQVSGFRALELTAGTTSFGLPLPAKPLQGRLEEDGVDVTGQLMGR